MKKLIRSGKGEFAAPDRAGTPTCISGQVRFTCGWASGQTNHQKTAIHSFDKQLDTVTFLALIEQLLELTD